MSKAFREKSASGLRDEKMRGEEDRNFNQSPFIDVRVRLGYIVEVTFITEWESEWDFSTRCLHSKRLRELQHLHACTLGANRPFPSSKKSHFQNEAKCETFVAKINFICIIIKIIFISMASHLASL